jgi:mono/diheme cytochrome c family protein
MLRLNGLLIAGRPGVAVLGLGAGVLALCAAAHNAPAQRALSIAPTRVTQFDAQPAVGDRVYTAHCAQCHGTAGKGDGKMAHDLGADVPDLTDGRLAHESDARLFRWISRGKRPMPSFEKDLSEPERWGVVAYLRTLEAKGGGGK